ATGNYTASKTGPVVSPSQQGLIAPSTGGGGYGATAPAKPAPPPGPTDEQKAAAANLKAIAAANAQSTKDQYDRAMQNYDLADQQNRQSALVQRQQASRASANDRFAQQRKLQAATKSVLGAAGNALQGSQLYGLIDILRGRDDLDHTEVLDNLTGNWNAIINALNESLSANVLARNEAASNAEFALRGIESDTSAQLGNIHKDLYVAPGTGGAQFGSAGYAAARQRAANLAQLAGYIQPEARAKTRAALPGGNSTYFDRLMTGYKGRQ
ncbi:hypothetical protein, partial [uncultured Halomonas sp.]|uniref:hypothetical protein n=1 Tax=uncultured Halomonas sp. TaxID=173971 RepID=UPI002620A4D1